LERALSGAAMSVIDRTGVIYHPLADRWQKSTDMDVNYMVLAEKAAAG
jgi:2-polyprenyl-6-hydroxyphenyl methylase/3-demethylubiquinone-9 3-methyltransferase